MGIVGGRRVASASPRPRTSGVVDCVDPVRPSRHPVSGTAFFAATTTGTFTASLLSVFFLFFTSSFGSDLRRGLHVQLRLRLAPLFRLGFGSGSAPASASILRLLDDGRRTIFCTRTGGCASFPAARARQGRVRHRERDADLYARAYASRGLRSGCPTLRVIATTDQLATRLSTCIFLRPSRGLLLRRVRAAGSLLRRACDDVRESPWSEKGQKKGNTNEK